MKQSKQPESNRTPVGTPTSKKAKRKLETSFEPEEIVTPPTKREPQPCPNIALGTCRSNKTALQRCASGVCSQCCYYLLERAANHELDAVDPITNDRIKYGCSSHWVRFPGNPNREKKKTIVMICEEKVPFSAKDAKYYGPKVPVTATFTSVPKKDSVPDLVEDEVSSDDDDGDEEPNYPEEFFDPTFSNTDLLVMLNSGSETITPEVKSVLCPVPVRPVPVRQIQHGRVPEPNIEIKNQEDTSDVRGWIQNPVRQQEETDTFSLLQLHHKVDNLYQLFGISCPPPNPTQPASYYVPVFNLGTQKVQIYQNSVDNPMNFGDLSRGSK